MAEVTRFYNRDTDQDGPVSGALQMLRIPVPSVTNTSVVYQANLPAGMEFEVTDIMFTASATGATPSLEVGTTSSGTQVVAAVTATTDLGALTIKDGTVDAGGDLFFTVICTASDTVTNGQFTVVGHVAAPPTSVAYRS